jgi:hypothetical protein
MSNILKESLKIVSPILGAAGVFDDDNNSLKMIGGQDVMPSVMPTTPASKASGMKKGGSVSSASKRADGIASKGKTRGKIC